MPNGGYARPGRPARLIAERDEIERSLVARIADYARKIVSDPRSASAPRSSRSGASIARRSCLRGHNSGMYRGGRSVWWRLAIAAALIFFLVAGIGDLLWAADLGTAANVAQLVSLASIPVGLVTWATARSPGGGQAAERTICFEEVAAFGLASLTDPEQDIRDLLVLLRDFILEGECEIELLLGLRLCRLNFFQLLFGTLNH